MSAVELLPCPFCGGEPTFIKIGNVHTKMAVTVRCPKCRVERTDATPKAFNHSDHGWLLATAGKNWNRRPTIAPPVAAGSVDTGSKHDVCRESERFYRQNAKDAIERAEKAEAELAQVNQWYRTAHQINEDLAARILRADDRIDELEAEIKILHQG